MPSGGRILPVLTALLVGAVGADIARRAFARPPAPPPSGEADPAQVSAIAGRTTVPASGDAEREARRLARVRLEAESAGTYVAGTLVGTDSVRRWPDAALGRPLRVAVVRTAGTANFREDFVANVAWAIGRWNGAGAPARLETTVDSAGADIMVTWVARLDSNRTGRADLTWDSRGVIRHVRVYLATHTPAGEPLGSRQMSALALHELGHALGLGHSSERADALFPVTTAIELTERDRRTLRLLYALPPGSLR